MSEPTKPVPDTAPAPPPPEATRAASPAAQRALEEAKARRSEIDRVASDRPKERDGRRGPDPVRYGDWEVKGIASDF
jgi:hypothetical protein